MLAEAAMVYVIFKFKSLHTKCYIFGWLIDMLQKDQCSDQSAANTHRCCDPVRLARSLHVTYLCYFNVHLRQYLDTVRENSCQCQ